MSSTTVAPELLWAQRSSEFDEDKNIVYLTINAPELSPDYKLDVSGTRLTFKGDTKSDAGSLEHRHYAVDIELFAEASIKGEPRLIGKSLSVVLQKKETSEDYWPRLTKEKRVNFVKTDFSKWVDQDEQDALPEDDEAPNPMSGGPGAGNFDMASMMAGMGGSGMGAGAGGMPPNMDFEKMMAQMQAGGMGGAGGGPNFGEEDDDDMPELESAPSKGAADDDDEEMPPLTSE